MSRRDVEQGLSVVPFAEVPDLMSFEIRTVFRALPLDEDVLRSFALNSFPERRAAIAMLRGREVMMRRTEAVVRELGLPRPRDSSILRWMPGGHIIGTEPMSLRWQLIREEMLKYNTFPWVELDGVNTGFIRPELYVIEAFHLSSLDMREIYAIIKIVAEYYPQHWPVESVQIAINFTTGRSANMRGKCSDECSLDSDLCFNGCRICLGRHWKVPW